MTESSTAPAEFSTGEVGHKGRPPVVLQLLPRLESGGVERGTIEIAAALARAGWKPLVASTGGPMEHQLTRAGGRHFTLPLAAKSPWSVYANIARLARLIEAEGVDIVHARSRIPAWSGCFAARRTGARFVTTYHGTYFGGGGLKRWYNSIMLRGERVIVTSQFIREHVLERYSLDPSRLRFIPRGVDTVEFDPERAAPERRISLLKEWRIPDHALIVTLPARLTAWKGQEIMIDAIARLGHSDVYCLLLGEDHQHGRVRRRLEARASARGLGDRVRIVGICRDMPAAYMLSDVVVSASILPEAFGRTMIEAQAMGRPVIATDHGGVRETVRPGETGWLVPPGDVDALAGALRKALSLTPRERERMAQAAIAHTRAEYDVRLMCERTLAVYRELLSPGQRARA